MKHAVKHIHFVGIGGAGMSGIAEILHNLGYRVSGSDQIDSPVIQRLAELGVKVAIGHDAHHIEGAQAVVTSTAVQRDNPEVVAARSQRIPVVARAVLLADLMRLKQGIAIAGTHGKTTTTSLVASVLAEAGVDPTYVIGGVLMAPRPPQAASVPQEEQASLGRPGEVTTAPRPPQAASVPQGELASLGRPGERLDSDGANSRLGTGDYIVVEADESDASFLHLSPVLSVVTNIDADHMETYGHDLSRLRGAFVEFIHRLPFYGSAVVCSDDAGVRAILPMLSRPVIGYGLGDDAQVRATQVHALPGGQMRFVALRQHAGHTLPPLPVLLNLAGEQNVRNALAAISVAMVLELPDEPVARALAAFAGVGRRFQRLGELPTRHGGRFTLIDDYGHHPVEMAAVLSAARGAFPGRRLLLAFQPHRYTRTRDCFEDFVQVLGGFDAVLLTDVYPAGETPIVAADGRALSRALRVAGRVDPVFVANVVDLPEAIAVAVRDGDVLITMGAGSIGQVPRQVEKLMGAAS